MIFTNTPHSASAGGGVLEPLLQLLLILRNLLGSLATHQREEELADAMALEVELDRDSRASAVAERLEVALPGSDGPSRPWKAKLRGGSCSVIS